jgi:2-hydroxy-4-carboxymuconate semialdehyde hemiacetal dehydrogenase
MAMNVCMVGYGMMGQWHSEALKRTDAVLHTVVGRREEAAKEFAARYGYKKWTASLDQALADPAVDIVIIGSPSEQHEAQAIRCLEAGKHTLIEIPVAMSLAGAERAVRSTGSATPCGSGANARRCALAFARVRRRSGTLPGGSSSSGW